LLLRTVRIALADATLWFAMALSAGTSIFIFNATGYIFIIGLGLVLHTAAFTYIALVLPESKSKESKISIIRKYQKPQGMSTNVYTQ
jgi:hypothetical protein